MTPSHREFDPGHIPLAFMITLRAHGTWLHGDRRGSVNRFHNEYGTPRLPPNPLRRHYERQLPKTPPCKTHRETKSSRLSGHSRDMCYSQLAFVGA